MKVANWVAMMVAKRAETMGKKRAVLMVALKDETKAVQMAASMV